MAITEKEVIEFLQANNKNFNFKIYNAMVNPVATGLKIALAENLLRDAHYVMSRFNNPLVDDAFSVYQESKQFKVKYKAQSEERRAKAENPASESKENVAGRNGV